MSVISEEEKTKRRLQLLELKRKNSLEAKKQPEGNFWYDLTRQAVQGLSLGTGDEVEALIKSTFGDKTYSENLSQIRSSMKRFEKDNPKLAFTAELVGSIPSALAGGAGLARLGVTSIPKVAALEGGLYGFADANPEQGSSLKDQIKDRAITGALSGALSAGAGKGLDLVTPKITDAAKNLLRDGISLTPGQTVGGMTRKFEERLSSIPVVGDIISSAEDKIKSSFNIKAMNKALAPLGVKVPSRLEGQEAFSFAKDAVDSAYQKVIDKNLGIGNTVNLENAVQEILEKNVDLPPELSKILLDKVDRELLQRFQGEGTIKSIRGQAFKDAESALGSQAVNFISSSDPFQRQMGVALFDVQTALREELAKKNPLSKDLQNANASFRQLLPIQNAVVASVAQGGKFTPAQLLRGIRKADRSKNKTTTARGEAPLQSFAQDAQNVIGRNYPNSGTVDRGLTALLMDELIRNPVGTTAKIGTVVPATGLLYSNPLGRNIGRNILQVPRGVGIQSTPFAAQSLLNTDAVSNLLGVQ